MSRRLSILIAVALALIPGARAAAESPSIKTAFGATQYYDSNLFRLSPAEKAAARADPGGRSIDDHITQPFAGIEISQPVSLQTIDVRAGVAYSLHRQNARLDTATVDLLGRWRWEISDVCSGAVEYGWKRNLAEFEDISVRRRIVQLLRSTNANSSCAWTPNLRGALLYESSERENRDAFREIPDLAQSDLEGRLIAGSGQAVNLYAFGRRRKRMQDLPIPFTPGGSDELITRIIDLGGGIVWEMPAVHLEARLYRSRLRDNQDIRRDTRLSGEFALDWTISSKAKFQFEAERTFDVSPNLAAAAFPVKKLRASLSWEATPKLTTELTAAQRWRRIARLLPQSSTIIERRERDDTFSIESAVTYAIADQIKARASLSHYRRQANFEDIGFAATTALVGLTFAFDFSPTPRANLASGGQ